MRLTANDFRQMYDTHSGRVVVWFDSKDVSRKCFAFDPDMGVVELWHGEKDENGNRIFERKMGHVQFKIERF